MVRGGSRQGAGRKSTWASGRRISETTLIRVPKEFALQLLQIAHKLDAGENIDLVTQSNIDLVTESTSLEISDPVPQKDLVTQSNILAQTQLSLLEDEQAFNKKQLTLQDLASGLIAKELAERLGTSKTSVSLHKHGKAKQTFEEWTSQLDPEGISWTYSEDLKKFFPLM